MKNVTLEEVLAYNNSDIPARFVKIYGVTTEEAQTLFDDVKRWLWLANEVAKEGKHNSVTIDQSIIAIDEMWHNFVLFTREYVEFCSRFFGRYMHHAPFAESEKKEMEDKFKDLGVEEKKRYLMDQKRWQYEFIYDVLGEETFIRWYKTYPQQYSAMILAEKVYLTEKDRHDTRFEELRKKADLRAESTRAEATEDQKDMNTAA